MDHEPNVLNWLRVTEHMTTSGQPSEVQPEEIQRLGVTHVINLGLHSHPRALADEPGDVTRLGMTYIHIAVDFESPTEDDFTSFCRAIDELSGKSIHVHCIVNARVTAFLYRYRTEVLGENQMDARAMMEQVWRPGGIWATFIHDKDRVTAGHEYAGIDY